ncbi:hypothetical protein RN001_013356 [Aquatica leii]|uniref:Protein sleepless n=1 Tax=Aquatica leii TaxID=1421715 RepID=A0AAN7P4B5_9COLE|nr:hypothetical protein RN001_013356 [Aquatica leii]
MGKYVYVVTCVLLLCETGFSLRCYVCDSTTIDGCIKETRPRNYTCGSKIGYFRQVCAYTVLHDDEKDDYKVHTGCELIYEKDPLSSNKVRSCLELPNNYQLKECRICDQDLCNSSNNLNNVFLLLYLFVTYLITHFVVT